MYVFSSIEKRIFAFESDFCSFFMAGIYIHIPFCKTRCTYCDFHSGTNLQLKKQYVKALCDEIGLRKKYLGNQPVKTIYFGGGTPSLLTTEELASVFDVLNRNFDLSQCEEVTLECNPDDLSANYVLGLKQLPINRLSIGVQSFNDVELRFVNRRHSAQQAIEAVKRCQRCGFVNISVDLMFGLPFQSVDSFNENLRIVTQLNVPHVSVYGLTFEQGTTIDRQRKQKIFVPTDEEVSILMYENAIQYLTSNGFEHYEISNFAKSGMRSKHNSSYWDGTHYLGIGSGAHSYNGVSRQWNVCDTRKYCLLRDYYEIETLSCEDVYNELIITNLRRKEGVDLEFLLCRFGERFYRYCRKNAQQYLQNELLVLKNNRLCLTQKGLLLSDSIIRDLMI